MTSISLPDPVGRRPGSPADSDALARDLRSRVDGEVRFDAGSRGAYSTDASNYRQVPIGVVVPRSVEAGAAAVAVCREHGVPVVSRGGGTSLAGQSCNVAVVIDWSKYCHGHARPLHAGRHARQQLVRSDRPGLRQDRRQRDPAGGADLRR
jgi:hypothetical protein